MLLAAIDLVDYVVKPVGYDRYIVSLEMLGSEFHANARYLVQKLENGYVILLPGVAFEKDGKVKTEEGSLVFGTENGLIPPT